MKNKIKHELFTTEKFETLFSYQSVLTQEEKEEVALYRAELVKLLNDKEGVKYSIPPRPPVFDRYN